MPTYDLGDGVNLRHLVYDRNGALADATVVLAITRPSGAIDNPTVTRTSIGQYDAATYAPSAVGDYTYRWLVTGTVTDVAPGVFSVADPAPALYTSLPMVKAQLGKATVDDRDDLILAEIRTASRRIDRLTGRRFYADAVATARTYSLVDRTFRAAGGLPAVLVDDISSTTGVTVELGNGGSGIYATPLTSFITGPDNAIVKGEPVQHLVLPLASLLGYGITSVRVTARWGWPRVPDQVEAATRLLATRLYRRKDSPQGVIASADWGTVRVSRVDPDVMSLLSDFMVPGFA